MIDSKPITNELFFCECDGCYKLLWASLKDGSRWNVQRTRITNEECDEEALRVWKDTLEKHSQITELEAQLAAANESLHKVKDILKTGEWRPGMWKDRFCIECMRYEDHGHDEDCHIAKALAAIAE